MKKSSSQVYISWRLLDTDPQTLGFNVYRSANGGAAVKLNGSPITATTDYTDTTFTATVSNTYYIRPVWLGVEETPSTTWTIAANAPCPTISLDSAEYSPPASLIAHYGSDLHIDSANDCSVGDLDGDGQYEIVLKWDPSNSKDNSISGYTGDVYIDRLQTKRHTALAHRSRQKHPAGAHYTQFIVYDLDGDGKAEVAMKTAPGTIDGQGKFVLLRATIPRPTIANSSQRLRSCTGPEYLTVFNGQTGAAMATTSYLPAGETSATGATTRQPLRSFSGRRGIPGRDKAEPDRVPRILSAQSSYAAKNEIVAWNYRNGHLLNSGPSKPPFGEDGNINSDYVGQGDQALTIADVDGDGKDEIIYGSAVIDDNGTGRFIPRALATATPCTSAISTHPGRAWKPGRSMKRRMPPYGYELHDAATGAIIWGGHGTTGDTGADVAITSLQAQSVPDVVRRRRKLYDATETWSAPDPSPTISWSGGTAI